MTDSKKKSDFKKDKVNYYKEIIAREKEAIRERHLNGATGREIVESLCRLSDRIITELYEFASKSYSEDPSKHSKCVIAAVGGYGRGSLSPFSDIDVMFLYQNRVDEFIQTVSEDIFHILWDLGFDLGHSCRSVGDCLKLAENDFKTMTSLIEARFITGDKDLFDSFSKTFNIRVLHRKGEFYLRQKVLDRNKRYSESGRTIQVLEPNIKDGPGGLRDIHTIYWIGKVVYKVDCIKALVPCGCLSQEDHEAIERGLNFLWRVRNDLHYLSSRKNDILGFEFQTEIAKHLRYKDEGNKPAVEHFMKDYYFHAKINSQICTDFIKKTCKSDADGRKIFSVFRQRNLEEGFVLINDSLYVARNNTDVFQNSPVKLLQVFEIAQNHGYNISDSLLQTMKKEVTKTDGEFKWGKEGGRLFLSILNSKKQISRKIRQMHETGVLDRFIPEFGELDCLVQFDIYHHYTVDEHTLIALEKLDELEEQNPRESIFCKVYREIERKDLLRLAVLLHDIGKVGGKGHVPRSADISRKILNRMDISPDDMEKVLTLIGNHVLMMHTAERRDFLEEKTIKEFSKTVGDLETLKMLMILTYADVNAVSPYAWNEWRSELVSRLYFKTYKYFTKRLYEDIDYTAEYREKINSIIEKVINKSEGTLTREQVVEFFDTLPERYITGTLASRIYTHYKLLREMKGKTVTSSVIHNSKVGYSDFLVCFEGRIGSFSKTCGVLTSKGIQILGAEIYTNSEGVAVDTLQCSDREGKAAEDDELWMEIEEDLALVLEGKKNVEEMVERQRKYIMRKRYGAISVPTEIKINNEESNSYTIIEVHAQDRIGLLYDVTRILAELRLDINLAKIVTEGNQAIQIFYLTDEEHKKIRELERLQEIASTIKKFFEPKEKREVKENVRSF
ncbi:MAG: [protein-PII] uridylyltransferase [Candidatus Schekmanbacteria bacterium GWA2_38_9]|uniref:Bifunctional uridylyltransferase/uridylyl-removing enzyme n=1 Tax=Candidatus Schekmanbacteria bacterium RIFCSPLOWO2_12_FULL_38_15 TaxID=1817883 RepID=A0A1F7SIV7_9BACT|nr:MAG: [protein-PII] uridylyltransferase [Candidatus Schekmanbacteria bacterium GWA2_38_9]OGL49248.1 MAG: [protein-PII] uridylyltransferase [Candidatus Schekmanbacteria bacterium RIFCSPLOWO2_02_FULL_38_14]OGL53703.1 MAG: [protein-PII] uridylyltransferase [Candidatus Schekmanbacteria bacterium RIFCSPLOWO2_12_FULL_38_15]